MPAADPSASPGRFTVDEDHPGVPERAWEASPGPRLPLLDVAAVLGLPSVLGPPFVPGRPVALGPSAVPGPSVVPGSPAVPDLSAVRRAVVVAPHPDDEVLGAGGLVQRLAASGVAVEVWGVTDGEACFGPLPPGAAAALRAERLAESAEALRRLGLPPTRRRRLREGDGAVREAEVRRALDADLDRRTLCVAPWSGDGHPDHDAAGRAAADACRDSGAGLVQYLVWAWHWADPAGGDLPWDRCRRLALTRREAAAKRWATGAFPSQTRRPSTGAGSMPVLPPSVLRRFWRRWEVYVTDPC